MGKILLKLEQLFPRGRIHIGLLEGGQKDLAFGVHRDLIRVDLPLLCGGTEDLLQDLHCFPILSHLEKMFLYLAVGPA